MHTQLHMFSDKKVMYSLDACDAYTAMKKKLHAKRRKKNLLNLTFNKSWKSFTE